MKTPKSGIYIHQLTKQKNGYLHEKVGFPEILKVFNNSVPKF